MDLGLMGDLSDRDRHIGLPGTMVDVEGTVRPDRDRVGSAKRRLASPAVLVDRLAVSGDDLNLAPLEVIAIDDESVTPGYE